MFQDKPLALHIRHFEDFIILWKALKDVKFKELKILVDLWQGETVNIKPLVKFLQNHPRMEISIAVHDCPSTWKGFPCFVNAGCTTLFGILRYGWPKRLSDFTQLNLVAGRPDQDCTHMRLVLYYKGWTKDKMIAREACRQRIVAKKLRSKLGLSGVFCGLEIDIKGAWEL
ncbi:hypothetical protein BDV96DRAFT_194992 [Lophiotrema nucula]|uniref:Uncharacterized protein n=1 Tax=Lophiotrema nucula TaxID=690887 RepID=A0A6A5YWU4_9PLEO|nr:hypothetical protein BDV96DRAFT_194992 [Lophiotrema nucula]